VTLEAKPRPKLGSRYSGRVRAAGGLPGVLYGHGQAPVTITVDAKEASRHVSEGKRVFTLKLEGSGEETALLRDIQFDHLGSRLIHMDFARVSLTERVEVKVHVNMKGEAIGLKSAGAVLIHPVSEVMVRCLVTDIVDHVDLDITDLAVDAIKHASDLKLPEGYELLTDPHAVLASIQIKAEEVVAEAAPAEGEAAQPEVLTEKKPAEGAEKAAPAGEKGGKKKE
jgi:large subunit ribosomal protein L25